jgi:hypothetical protein
MKRSSLKKVTYICGNVGYGILGIIRTIESTAPLATFLVFIVTLILMNIGIRYIFSLTTE